MQVNQNTGFHSADGSLLAGLQVFISVLHPGVEGASPLFSEGLESVHVGPDASELVTLVSDVAAMDRLRDPRLVGPDPP